MQNDKYWRSFPEFEASFTDETRDRTLGRIEKTCRQLEAIQQAGSSADRERAGAALLAYRRLLELVETVTAAARKQAAA